MRILLALGLLVLVLQNIAGLNEHKVEKVFQWNKVEFEFLPKSEYTFLGPYKYYVPENNAIGGFGYHPASKLVIVVFPRIKPGLPVTLGAFCARDYLYGQGPRIWGFPNYLVNELQAIDFLRGTEEDRGRRTWNRPADPVKALTYYSNSYFGRTPDNDRPFPVKVGPLYNLDRIISVFQVTVDEKCNRVFFVDNGQVQYSQNSTYYIQKPALLVLELPTYGCESRNFPIIRRVELPDKVTEKGSYGFAHITLDYQSESSCDDLFVYFTNTFFNYITVYDYKNNDFWTLEHQTFQPVVSESFFTYDKSFEYQLSAGVFSISLGYPDVNGDKTAFYTPIAGTAQYAVSTKVLKNKNNSFISQSLNDFRIMGYRSCNHQSFKTVIDYNYGVMFYSEVQSNQLRCWNIKKPLNPDYIGVVYESEEFSAGFQMFIDSQGYLWFQSTSVPVTFATDSPLDFNKINQRIFRIRVSDAIQGTVCAN
ncbi:L-dopachrome tautomerase yellow-f2-like [Phlebotomus argentipes]|uniref:L-dopachrome tautomerase yellow-f2-like n=1 Tax=Phlebotomus argentipes TaxID=94469 RepID=UPI0028929F72|nr:L-dopachrome tautomerase yellow-f2-like [Phlebotomus argentipes]